MWDRGGTAAAVIIATIAVLASLIHHYWLPAKLQGLERDMRSMRSKLADVTQKPAPFVDEERNVGPSISKIARERHLDFFLRDSGSICSDHCLVGDALSYYAMIAACEARRIKLTSADLQDVPALRSARKACEKLARRRRRRENALEGRSTSIARRWIFQPGDEAICVALSDDDGRDRRCVIVSRTGALASGEVVWRIASDGISDQSIVASLLKKDLAALNAGATIEAREKALAAAEVTLAVRTRAEQRRVLAEARAALGPDAERHALSSLRSSADAKPNLDATASLWARCSASRINCGRSCAKRPSPGFVIFPAKNASPSGVGGGVGPAAHTA